MIKFILLKKYEKMVSNLKEDSQEEIQNNEDMKHQDAQIVDDKQEAERKMEEDGDMQKSKKKQVSYVILYIRLRQESFFFYFA